MTILLLTISFTIDDAYSLKDKRKVVKSIIHKAQDRFKVSSAEVNYQEIHNLSELAFVMVTGQYSVAKEHMDKLFAFIENTYPIQITHYEFSEL